MASAMEQSSCSSRRYDEPELSLREWGVKARVSRENTASRRYSASYIRGFGEDSRSFRSNITIYSTASSPGYCLKGTSLIPFHAKLGFASTFPLNLSPGF